MQDRLTYASGNTITTEGFRCAIGEPIDIKVTVGESEEVDLPDAAAKRINPGNYLITLEVNGEKAAYRDLYHLGEDSITIGDYTISDDLLLAGVSEDDEVVMRLEPVELTVTDEFRAAVGMVAPTSGGGSGGGVLVVTVDENDTLDKTWREIDAADAAVIVFSGSEEGETWHGREFVVNTSQELNGDYFVNSIASGGESSYMVTDPDDYPVRQP